MGLVAAREQWMDQDGRVPNLGCKSPAKNGQNCLDFFRCRTFDEYLAEHQRELNADLMVLNREVVKFECHIEDMNLNGGVVGPDEAKTVFAVYRILYATFDKFNVQYATDLSRGRTPNEADLTMLKILKERLRSIEIQLRLNHGRSPL
jgi:hypothetical protein